MARIPSEVHGLFRRQHGVASGQQIREHGVTRKMLASLVECGDLIAMMRGVYRSPSVEETELMRCAAVSLAHERVAVSGPTAGRVWGLRRMSSDRRVHVVAPRHWRATNEAWCVAYRTDAIHDVDIVDRDDGIRVTSRERTALDLARSIRDDDRLLSVIEQAAHDGALRDGDLRAVAVDWVVRRPWVARYLRQVDRRLTGPAAESEPEVKVGTALARAGVGGLVRQHPLLLPGYGSIRFDMAVPMHRWAVEVDVFPTHRETIGVARDRRRGRAAASAGWIVRRITEQQYRFDFDATIVDLAAEAASLPLAA